VVRRVDISVIVHVLNVMEPGIVKNLWGGWYKLDKTKMLADDKGVNGPGRSFFVGRVASIVEEALLIGQDNVSVERLLKAFNDAREYSKRNEKL